MDPKGASTGVKGQIPVTIPNWGFPKIRGYHFGGPHSKGYNIFGVYIEVPLFLETTKCSLYCKHSRAFA